MGTSHINEEIATRCLFLSNPNKSFCRLDIVEEIHKPISNVCRLVFNLIDDGFIEVSHKGISPHTGVCVEFLRLKDNRQLSLF